MLPGHSTLSNDRGRHADVTFRARSLDCYRCEIPGDWDLRGCNPDAGRREIQWFASGDPPVDMTASTVLARLYFRVLNPADSTAMIAVDHVSVGLPGAVKDTIRVC